MKSLKLLTLMCLALFTIPTSLAFAAKTVTAGSNVALTYSSTNVGSCAGINGPPAFGSRSVSANITSNIAINSVTTGHSGTYTFNCNAYSAWGGGVVGPVSDTLTVTQASCPADTPYTESNPSSIANYCAATGVTCPVGQTYVSSISCHTGGAGTWTPYGNSCTGANCTGCGCVAIPAASCTATLKSWPAGCSGSTVARTSGNSSTVTNTASGYTGSATYTCNNGVWSAPTGASCTAIPGSPTGNISASPNPCTIPSGGTSCSTTITWSTSNTPSSNVYRGTGAFASGLSGSQTASSITPTAILFKVKDSNENTLAQVSVSAVCASGSTWNGSSCATTTIPAASCSAMGTQTWLTSCSASVPGAASGGQSVVSNTASGYTGSATWACSNGTWSGPSSTSCTADAPAPVTINVNATSPLKVTPSSSFSFPFTYSISDGSTSGRCHLLNSSSVALTSWTAMTSPNSISWTAPSSNGQYTYYVECRKGTSSTIVDADNVVVRVCPLGLIWGAVSNACVPPSDLTAGTVTPLTALTSVTTTFSSTITNIGAGGTEGSFRNFMQYSSTNPETDPDPDIRDINDTTMSTLAAGASATATGSRRYSTAGTYYMRACADKDRANDTGDIEEANETNNCGAWTAICVGTAAQCSGGSPSPTIINPQVVNNNTPSGSLSFSCSNATSYSIVRDGTVLVDHQTYTSAVMYPVTTEGNYDMICWNGALSANQVLFYSPNSITGSVSLIAAPATAKAGALSTLSWNISNPTTICKITASPVYTAGSGADAGRDAAAATLTAQLTNPSQTDINDPYGQRAMLTALRTAAPGVTTKALGKKSLLMQYTTDFLLDCGTSTQRKVRVQVANENEG